MEQPAENSMKTRVFSVNKGHKLPYPFDFYRWYVVVEGERYLFSTWQMAVKFAVSKRLNEDSTM